MAKVIRGGLLKPEHGIPLGGWRMDSVRKSPPSPGDIASPSEEVQAGGMMIEKEGVQEDFGCQHCWPASADAAWDARRMLVHETELIDEAHFHVVILSCSRCEQRFVSALMEEIDWADGDDPQYWTLLPITDAEVADLVERKGSVTESQLNALGPGRRCLRHDHPKGVPPESSWSSGLRVGLHD